jgi:hypothetical protein
LQGPDEVTGDDMVAAMDAVGVDGALLISSYSMYRYDASYALEVYAKHPGRFGLIKVVTQLKEICPLIQTAGSSRRFGIRKNKNLFRIWKGKRDSARSKEAVFHGADGRRRILSKRGRGSQKSSELP